MNMDNPEGELFNLSENNNWKIYKCRTWKRQTQIDYKQGETWNVDRKSNNMITGTLNPNEALVLADISGGSSINDAELEAKFNIDLLKLSNQKDSIVLTNNFFRKSFISYGKEYRLQLDDKS